MSDQDKGSVCDEDEGLVTRMKDEHLGVSEEDQGPVHDQDEGLLSQIKAQCVTRVRDRSVSKMREGSVCDQDEVLLSEPTPLAVETFESSQQDPRRD